jgi:hypothetical protein
MKINERANDLIWKICAKNVASAWELPVNILRGIAAMFFLIFQSGDKV